MAYGLTQSVSLNGTSQYVSAVDSVSLSTTGNQTHEGWFNLTSQPATNGEIVILGKYNSAGGSNRGFLVVYEDSAGTKRFHLRTSANGSTVLEGTLDFTMSTGTWTHLAFAYSTAGTVEVIVNGVSQGTISSLNTSIFDNNSDYQIGTNPNIGTGGFFPGSVSLVRVWNTTRSAAQVLANMCNVFGTATTNMQAEWSLNNVLTDASGNTNTLTSTGSPSFTASVPATCAVTTLHALNLLGVGT